MHSFENWYSASSRKWLRGAPDSSTFKKNIFKMIIEWCFDNGTLLLSSYRGRQVNQWRRPGVEFGGTDQDFWMTVFSEKISIFTAKISDDLFFLFSHRPGFSDFPVLFTDFPYLYYVKCRMWPFPHKKPTFFTLFILSHTSDNTTSQNIGGGTNAWAVPHLKFGGTVPRQFPPRSPPLR